MKKILLALIVVTGMGASAQRNAAYWQQHVDYTMNIDMDAAAYQYKGNQKLVYTNNSPYTLKQVFYHLYFNAFQPGSEMDQRLQDISDPDGRMVNNLGTKENPEYESRISKLSSDEIGYLKIDKLTQDGQAVSYKEEGTILQVRLAKPIAPGESTTFNMNFNGQVPVQIRRSGRNNADGVALSMTQWYPKLAEYDFEGWHADPYIAREFHGVWGDFDVKISIDKNYILGGSGILQNPQEIGYGYEKEGSKVKRAKGKKLTWHFIAEKVHDFAWAADPDYIHDSMDTPSGVGLHFLYKNDPKVIDGWEKVQPKTAELLAYFNEHIGPYPWKQYSVIQGGDGGMEYANCTLITGGASFQSLYSTTAHEFAHSWFQQLLATNELEHPWMDEGFTSYIAAKAKQAIAGKKGGNPSASAYRGYNYIVKSGMEEPLTTHADHYKYNVAYSVAAYRKGAMLLSQLDYLIGEDNLQKTLHRYYDQWKFKHPTPNDFIRVAEKVSGAELGWYLNEWTRTTRYIDYAIQDVSQAGNKTQVGLKRLGGMAMPLELSVKYSDGTSQNIYIPLTDMRWEKPAAKEDWSIEKPWDWAGSTYTLELDSPKADITQIVIDKSGLMADVDRDNNVYGETEKE